MTIKAILESARRGASFSWAWCSRKPGILMLDLAGTTRTHIYEVYDEASARKLEQRLCAAGGAVDGSLSEILVAQHAYLSARPGER